MFGLVVVALIAVLHSYIAWFEMFAWESRGPQVFSSFTPEFFAGTVSMAANQGIYNAFLAAGLFWSLVIRDRRWQLNVATCFLLFVFVAGVVGSLTIMPRILLIQTIPSMIVLLALWIGSGPHGKMRT